jgi:hypothetical protein
MLVTVYVCFISNHSKLSYNYIIIQNYVVSRLRTHYDVTHTNKIRNKPVSHWIRPCETCVVDKVGHA